MKRAIDTKKEGFGDYREIVEEGFLDEVTGADRAIVHFYHNNFMRCKIVDKHLKIIAGVQQVRCVTCRLSTTMTIVVHQFEDRCHVSMHEYVNYVQSMYIMTQMSFFLGVLSKTYCCRG